MTGNQAVTALIHLDVADTVISRVRETATQWDESKMAEQVKSRGKFDPATSTTKALRNCIMDNCESTIRLRLRVKRRLRMDLLRDLGTITMYGYLFGRELLGTIERLPTYLTNDSDFTEKARMINEGTISWEFGTVWEALDEANHDLLHRFLAIPREEETHLFELFREDRARTTFLGMYIFGVACAMSEEALWPLLAWRVGNP